MVRLIDLISLLGGSPYLIYLYGNEPNLWWCGNPDDLPANFEDFIVRGIHIYPEDMVNGVALHITLEG